MPSQLHDEMDAKLLWCDMSPAREVSSPATSFSTNTSTSSGGFNSPVLTSSHSLSVGRSESVRREDELVKRAVRCVAPLLPPLPSLTDFDDITRRMRSSLDHTLFVYPVAFERFQHRCGEESF